MSELPSTQDAAALAGAAAVAGAEALGRSTARHPRVSDERLATMKEALSDGTWKTAREISIVLGTSDRSVRAVAEASVGEIISGQKGYKLTSKATIAEIHRAESWLRSQAKRMIQRAIAIRNAMNRRPVAALLACIGLLLSGCADTRTVIAAKSVTISNLGPRTNLRVTIMPTP